MSNITDTNLIALSTKFVGRSGFRVKTRSVGETILVDVFEYGKSTSKDRAVKMAREAARLAGSQAAPVLLSDYESPKTVNRLDPNSGHLITSKQKVRASTYMFK